MNARATSFATYQDLVGYIRCRNAGGSIEGCLSKGDNGIGAWGDVTAQVHTPMCAVPTAEMRRKWGSANFARGKRISVVIDGIGSVVCEVRDKGPRGVVDLNPAALVALGLPQDRELNVPATWEWL